MFAMEVFKKLQYIDCSTRATSRKLSASSAGLELCNFCYWIYWYDPEMGDKLHELVDVNAMLG